ncbi:alkaline phosphatase D family protein [Pelagicoccus sp. SDUM812002]|uniref:alkaline phosphatase D family protein n=1 Tax=Pelagicoccus sp. SDUM812002 TaxID=3041266 RepID=UPI00280D9634|nr:alkaline phosphatase D family protein [Pelagicoccus sp. SDUM812002]MDQ8184801.1 alkaline phosphatase D family protein [Pelagicoccus sp. SDUM812002]
MRYNASIVTAAVLAVCVAFGQSGGFAEEIVERIAFGSCLHQDQPAPIWDAIVASDPDAWVWLGDNIYGDTDDGEVLAAAYAKVKAHPKYEKLRESASVYGTWDDHDFGKNNGGREWHGKAVAQKALLDFLDEPSESRRRKQEGVYASYDFGVGEKSVKLLLIDVRSHRDNPKQEDGDIFGAAQRSWIERELSANEAALTIVTSGTQVIPEDHKYEKWAQFPSARTWFFERLVKYETGPVLFLSGDRHISEFSKLDLPGRETPLYELTSSSLTHSWTSFSGEPNRHRVGEVFHQNSFGMLEIDWANRMAKVSIRDEVGEVQQKLEIEL